MASPEDAELFNEDELVRYLHTLTSVDGRRAAAEWMAYHKANDKDIVKVWKRELLGAHVSAVPQLLFLGGDVIQLTSAVSPAFAAGIGRLLPTLVQTLLNKAEQGTLGQHAPDQKRGPRKNPAKLTPADLRTLHTCVMDLIRTLSTNPHIPGAWIRGIRKALQHSVEKMDYGWVYDGLRSTDDAWNLVEQASGKGEALKHKLTEMYSKLKYRKISGTPHELEKMNEWAAEYLVLADQFSERLEGLRGDIDAKVLNQTDAVLETLSARRQELLALKNKRGRDDDALASDAKRQKTGGTPGTRPADAPASDASEDEEDSDYESSDDGPKITLT
eukprot:TRINITY_DN14982_c0_g1_i1.p1 TRINITY_DN14982_c0_g1~~TRINITY_DN14982_c0_g1_i1.p1  ORF type:complete len:350 (+),score=124.70 TRINITY_DN14982_c0_g1_i1:59-1051(+)